MTTTKKLCHKSSRFAREEKNPLWQALKAALKPPSHRQWLISRQISSLSSWKPQVVNLDRIPRCVVSIINLTGPCLLTGCLRRRATVRQELFRAWKKNIWKHTREKKKQKPRFRRRYVSHAPMRRCQRPPRDRRQGLPLFGGTRVPGN